MGACGYHPAARVPLSGAFIPARRSEIRSWSPKAKTKERTFKQSLGNLETWHAASWTVLEYQAVKVCGVTQTSELFICVELRSLEHTDQTFSS